MIRLRIRIVILTKGWDFGAHLVMLGNFYMGSFNESNHFPTFAFPC